ncbi:MAG: guanylate kinase [Bryobacterales bacterium]|nr:guanylate kinase [Acidobacteriota bacterium]MCB9385124.1 guanylate kinase [Bryobacterales bacterium]
MSIVFIISAPSGSGKSTLVRRLMEVDHDREERRLQFSVSVTTRAPRPGDRPGEYKFIKREEFEELRDRGGLLEWAEVHGNFYGTARDVLVEAQQKGRDLILDIDVQGAAQLRETLRDAVTIFILPPSRQVLEERLRKRSSDTDEVIERRLEGAAAEVSDYEKYDYVLVNDDLDASFEQLRGILLAERCRQTRSGERLRAILESFDVTTLKP